MVQMDGVRDGWWTATMFSMEVAESRGESWSVPEGVKITSAKYVEFLTKNFLPWYKRRTELSWKESLCMIGCYGH